MCGTGGAWAQAAPANLVDSLRIVGIQSWEVVQTNEAYLIDHPQGVAMLAESLAQYSERSKDNTYYILRMQVAIENSGVVNVLFRDPQLQVSIVQLAQEGKVTSVSENGVKSYDPQHPPLRENIVPLGIARLVRQSGESWEPIADIQCPDGTQKSAESQHLFEIIVGKRDLQHAQILIDAFNVMNNQGRGWSLWIRGNSKVGQRGKGKGGETIPMIFTGPVEVVLKSKPTVPPYIIFPR
jgi:hypothetical protein